LGVRLQDNGISESIFNRMIIHHHILLRKPPPCSWLMLVVAAAALVVLAQGPSWAWGEEAGDRSTSNPYLPADLTVAGDEGCFATGVSGLSFIPCQTVSTIASDARDAQVSSAGQTASTSIPNSNPTLDEQQGLKVNPVTGLAVASQSNYIPLTASERWKLYLKMTYGSAGPYLSPVISALLLDQANGTPRQWGGGFPGFGRRLASRAGNGVLQGTFQAPLAAILHEDVRYIPTSHHSFQRRALHAVLYSFLTYNNNGHTTLNIANLTAYYASTAVTTAWLPGIGNAARYTFSNASEQIALSFPLNVVQEFWPEIRHHIFRQY
jgi:hypothetical protein